MIDTNTATCDAASHPTTFPSMADRPTAALPTLLRNRAWSLTDTGRPASPHFAYIAGLKVREEGEHYLPDLPRRADDEEYQAGPELSDAARAHTGNVRRALKHLDDAINLGCWMRPSTTTAPGACRPGPCWRWRLSVFMRLTAALGIWRK